jgi:hypothetical protein
MEGRKGDRNDGKKTLIAKGVGKKEGRKEGRKEGKNKGPNKVTK